MNHILITKKGAYIFISEDERNVILPLFQDGEDRMVFIKSINEALRLKSIDRVIPEEKLRSEIREENNFMRTGYLFDGTQVLKYGGRWYLASGTRNNEGFPEVEVDPEYYPEVRDRCVIPDSVWIAASENKLSVGVLKNILIEPRRDGSKFAQALAPGFSMLPPQEKAKVQEEVSKEERKLKTNNYYKQRRR